MQPSVTHKFLSTTQCVKTDALLQTQSTKVRRSEVKTILGCGASVISLHFLYLSLSFSLCVLTVSVFNTWVNDNMAPVPEKSQEVFA